MIFSTLLASAGGRWMAWVVGMGGMALAVAQGGVCLENERSAVIGEEQGDRAGQDAERSRRPNVVMIVMDDVGYGDMGAHGNTDLRTPAMDALHAESVRLTDFHVDPSCAPTRAALLTGRFSRRVGVWHTIVSGNLIARGERTLADLFAANGYRTACVGKWHNGGEFPFRAIDRGFDYHLGNADGGTGAADDFWGNDRLNDRYMLNGVFEQGRREGWAMDVYFEQAQRLLDEADEMEAPPLFLYLAPYLPHLPYAMGRRNLGEGYADLSVKHGAYYGVIEALDLRIGALRERLRQQGTERDTLFVLLSDNGSALGREMYSAGLQGRKGEVWEGGHRVSCLVRWPDGGIEGGRDVDALSAHVDWWPTLVELLGLEPLDGQRELDGVSLAGLLRGEEQGLEERSLVIERQRLLQSREFQHSVVLRGPWRLIDGNKLFHVGEDRHQDRDVAAEHPQLVAQLRRDFRRYERSVGRPQERVMRPILRAGEALFFASVTALGVDRTPWNQALVAKGQSFDGYWAMEMEQAGSVVLEVRRWPRELSLAMREQAPPMTEPGSVLPGGNRVGMVLYGGAQRRFPAGALPVHAVRVRVGDELMTATVGAQTEVVEFALELGRGEVDIRAELLDVEGECLSSAYYLYVRSVE